MLKEIIICIVIIVTIVFGNNATQNYTVNSVDSLTVKLEEIKRDVENNFDKEMLKQKTQDLNNDWEQIHDKLAYFIEHDELEKVETDIVSLTSFIETEEYNEAISELDKAVFMLKHIEDKYAFNLQNIF